MSKYRHLGVEACYCTWFGAEVTLPDYWDELNEEERIAYVKEAAGHEMLAGVADGAYEYGKQFRHVTSTDLEHWKVGATPLGEIAARPLVQLVLDGSYEHKEHIDWDDEEDKAQD